jgi:YVTN family beta-propeller protein
VTNSGDGTVSVIDGAGLAATIPVGSQPAGVAAGSAGIAYVANSGDGTVSVIDVATSAVTATITVGSQPVGVAADPAAGMAYVTNSGDGTVSVIDVATSAVTATITVSADPRGVGVCSAAGTVYVANWGDRTVSVFCHPMITTTSPLDSGTLGTPYAATLRATGGISPWTWTITGGSLLAGLTLSPSGTITGIPTSIGTTSITARATESGGNTATKRLTLSINCRSLDPG